MFPKIQSPCPFKNDLASIMDGDTCRVCARTVHDLNVMSEAARAAFLSSCSGEVCVSYSLRPAIVAAAMAIALPAAAQDFDVQDDIFVGGIDTAKVEYVSDPNAVETPDAPIVFEDEETEAESSAASAANLNDTVETQ
ncbi:MAG: hypothetical protein R3C30_06660 [Hyphomonadaceae bacterium]